MRAKSSLCCSLICALAASVPTSAQDHDNAEIAVAAEALFTRFYETGHFTGAVHVMRNGETLLRRGYGMADHEASAPNTPETRYIIASVTKAFTATLIMRLSADGVMSLDAPLSAYLPELTGPAGAASVRQALEHRAGLMRDYTEYLSGEETPGPAAAINVANRAPLLFAPGEGYAYSNTAYVLLGEAAARAAGEDYASALAHYVLEPLELENTGYADDAAPPESLAAPYDTALLVHPSPADDPELGGQRLLGAGGVYSTVDDLLAFGFALDDGELISTEALSDMLDIDGDGQYGLEAYEVGAGADGAPIIVISASGASNGYLTFLTWLEGEDTGAAFALNTTALGRAGAPLLVFQTLDLLRGEINPPRTPETPLRDVVATLFADGEDAAFALAQTLGFEAPRAGRASAAQATGAPNGGVGETPLAWAPASPNAGEDHLALTFDAASPLQRLDIHFTQNAGGVTSVELTDAAGETLRHDLEALEIEMRTSESGAPILSITTPDQRAIISARINMDTTLIEGWPQIDAVALIDDDDVPHWAVEATAGTSAAASAVPILHEAATSEALNRTASRYEAAGRAEGAAALRALALRIGAAETGTGGAP